MPELKLLGELIQEGVKISNTPENRSYPRSYFKRTVNGWESDYKKFTKKADEGFKLAKKITDLKENIINEESQDKAKKSKYNKEKEKLEKEKNKLESQYKKYSDEMNLLYDKLIEKMIKEANKYLKEKKDLINDEKGNNTTLIKNPELYEKINKAKQDLKNNIQWFDDIIEEASKLYEDERTILSKRESYEPFCEYYYNKVANKDITQSTSFDKWMETINFDEKKDDTALTRGFSTWLKQELYYLEKFKNNTITISELFDYYKHGAYIEKLIDKIPAKKINSATTGYFKKLPKSLLRKILLAVGTPASAIFFFTKNTAIGVIKSCVVILLLPIAIIYDICTGFLSPLSALKELALMPKFIFNISFYQPVIYTKYNVKSTIKSIKSIDKETFDESFIKELENNKIKINSSASATLISLTKKTTEKIKKLEAELKKLEVSEEPKKEHGTSKVKYMHKVLDELNKE